MNTKLKCLLLDDELPGLAYLRLMCEQHPNLEVVRVFNDPMKFMEEFPLLDFSLCILDIEMPGLSGMEVARVLKGKSIIFTSAYKEYAAEAFDLEAIDYVRKPIKKERFDIAIQRVLSKLTSTTNHPSLQLNTSKGRALIPLHQLLLISTSSIDKRDKMAYLNDGTILILKNISFKQLLDQLPADAFCRINKRDLIAFSAVSVYTHSEVTLRVAGLEKKLSLGDNFKREFLVKMQK